MSRWDFDQVLRCNSTMKAVIDANWDRHKLDMAYDAFIASYYCRDTGNATLTKEADRIWVVYNNWGYWPSNGWAMFTLIAFGVSALFHIYQLVRSRYWSFIMVVMGCGGEMYGWAMRWIGGHDLLRGFAEQLAALTVSPIVFSGALYSLFGLLARSTDPSLLPMGSKRLTWWLFGIEFLTLLVQVGGGVIAAGSKTISAFETGSHIMLAGIVAQLVVTILFLVVFTLFFSRLRSRRGVDIRHADEDLKKVFWGIIAIASLIVIRGVFRTAELSGGMFGPIAYSQASLIIFDCIPMLAVTYIFNFIHPLYTLNKRDEHGFNEIGAEGIKLGKV